MIEPLKPVVRVTAGIERDVAQLKAIIAEQTELIKCLLVDVKMIRLTLSKIDPDPNTIIVPMMEMV
jgi:hypothetical protein